MRIAVIADDLTGALDTGVQFTQWGYRTQLTDDPRKSTAEVTIINTNTRNKPPEQAYETTYEIARHIDHDIIYKKTDSTLRGNPGQEIQAILDATRETRVIFTSAYPPTGRRIKDGRLYVYNKPITETEYIQEYRQRTSYIPEILETETPIHILKDTRDLPETGIAVFDSETERDLQEIAAYYARIYAGSAGLADALCHRLRDPRPVLIIIGSMRTETRTQAEQLVKRLGTSLIPLNTVNALNRVRQGEAVKLARGALGGGRDVIISSTHSQSLIEETQREAKRLNLSPNDVEIRITEALASVTKALLDAPLSGLIITGGATALAITEKLNIENIEILDEVQPGVPVLRLDTIPAVTKAGGFGQPDTLIQATQYLKRKHR